MNKIKDFLERNSKIITEIIEDTETYKVEDISILTKLNCEIANVLLKIEGVNSGVIRTSKTSSKANKGQK